jgi:hypothetical protein
MTRGGYVKVFRALAEHPALRKPIARALFLEYLMRASWQDEEVFCPYAGRGGSAIKLERGQCLASIRNCGLEGVTYRQARTAHQTLIKAHIIDAANDHNCTIITICNYEKYQGAPGNEDAPERRTYRRTQTQKAAQESLQEPLRKKESVSLTRDSRPGGEGEPPDADLFGEVVKEPSKRDIAAQMVQIWNQTCADILPEASLTDRRVAPLNARYRSECRGDLEQWRALCQRVRRSSFLTTRMACGLDWVAKPSNFQKITEGNYDDRIPAKPRLAFDADALADDVARELEFNAALGID